MSSIRIYEWPRWWAQQIRRTAPNRTFRQAQSSALVPTPSTELGFCSCKMSQDVTRCRKMLQDVLLFRKNKGNQRSKTNLCSLMFAICNDLMIPGPRIFLLELLGPVLWRERNSVKDQYNSDQHDHPSCIVFGHTLSLKKVIKGMESCLNGMQADAG